jgi:integrase
LKDAKRKRLVIRNVAKAADPPRLRQAGSLAMNTWTASQLRIFLDEMSSHRLSSAYLLAATTGMRRGEVLGLRWADLDLERHRLAVRQTVITINYEVSIGQPKTQKGRRSISLDSGTIEALASHRARQQAERESLGAAYADRDLVFAKTDGSPLNPDYFSKVFDHTVSRLEIPRIRLHDLRHTHATLGLAVGIPVKVMSDRLGHATAAFTQDVYMHVSPQQDGEAAERIAALLGH